MAVVPAGHPEKTGFAQKHHPADNGEDDQQADDHQAVQGDVLQYGAQVENRHAAAAAHQFLAEGEEQTVGALGGEGGAGLRSPESGWVKMPISSRSPMKLWPP